VDLATAVLVALGLFDTELGVPLAHLLLREEETNHAAPGDIAQGVEHGGSRRRERLVVLAVDDKERLVLHRGIRRCRDHLSDVASTSPRASGRTVGHEHRVDDLHTVTLAELGHDLHGSGDGLVKRRRTHTHEIRVDGASVTVPDAIAALHCLAHDGVGVSEAPDVRHLTVERRGIHRGREQVQEREVAHVDVRFLGAIPHLVLATLKAAAAERIDIERNADAPAEHHHLKGLCKDGADHRTHAARPVEEHHEPVVLARGHDGIATEDVVSDAVVTHTNRIDDTSSGDASTRRRIGSLTHLKLLHHERHDGL